MGAWPHGGVQGASRGAVRRGAAQDRDRQDPLAQAAGRRESEDLMKASLFTVLLLVSAPVFGQIEIDKPWARTTAPGAKLAAGYMVIRNQAAGVDRLVGASSPAAARVETHVTTRDGE